MGLEGAVRLGYSKEIAAAEAKGGTKKGDAIFNKLLDAMIANGKALNAAMYQEIDAVIDPKDTRHYLLRALKSLPVGKKGGGGKRPFIPTCSFAVSPLNISGAAFRHAAARPPMCCGSGA